MSRAALIWMEDNVLKSAPLSESGESVIGRGQDVAVVLLERTVSRYHARVRCQNGRFLIEQISPQNPTLVNNQVVQSATALTDKAVIKMGGVRMVFHDLEAADQPVVHQKCGICGKDNPSGRKDCWYCGTNMANAPTIWIQRRASRLRLAAGDGTGYDFFDDEACAIRDNGAAVGKLEGPPPGDTVVAIEVHAGQPRVSRTFSTPVSVNGATASIGQQLQNGDLLGAGAQKYVILVR